MDESYQILFFFELYLLCKKNAAQTSFVQLISAPWLPGRYRMLFHEFAQAPVIFIALSPEEEKVGARMASRCMVVAVHFIECGCPSVFHPRLEFRDVHART
jgi:hypothetical protein